MDFFLFYRHSYKHRGHHGIDKKLVKIILKVCTFYVTQMAGAT